MNCSTYFSLNWLHCTVERVTRNEPIEIKKIGATILRLGSSFTRFSAVIFFEKTPRFHSGQLMGSSRLIVSDRLFYLYKDKFHKKIEAHICPTVKNKF